MIVHLLRTLWIALVAVTSAALRRLRRGPLVPGWDWRTELARAGLRAVVLAGMQRTDAAPWSDLSFASPLPRRLRGVVEVRPDHVGGVPGEWYRCQGTGPDRTILLAFHGGAYVVGSPSAERHLYASLAWAAHADCFSVDYRLAPRHRFPAPVDDAVAAYRGILDLGTDPARIVVTGDSAGGGLAAALLVRLRDEGIPLPAGAVLWSPWVDLTNSAATIRSNARTDYLPEMAGRPIVEYLGDADPRHPHASPLYADLAGLPPLLVLAGEVEMILDDAVRLVERAREAGVDASLSVEPGMYHVWPAVLPRHPASIRAIGTAADWIARRVYGSVERTG